MSEADTDTKIALLASLLEPATYPISEYVEALSAAHGDVAKAAEALLLPRVKSAGKRKAGASIESWLGRKRGKDLQGGNIKEEMDDLQATDVSPVKARPTANLLTVLRQTSPSKPVKAKSIPQPALLLTSQASIDAHKLPVTLLHCPLSPSFASALYLALMDESERWDRNRWYLAGKWVESPHTTTVYARKGGGYGQLDREGDEGEALAAAADGDGAKPRYYYSGTELGVPDDYPPLLKKAAELIEPVVNAAIRDQARYPLEWAGDWKANVCGANRYDGANSGVGWHADQLTCTPDLRKLADLTDLGPYATIASLSLGTPRAFRFRQTDPVDPAFASNSKPIRTYEVNLGHNSLCLMNAGCQERYKHTVPAQKALDLFRPGFDLDEKPIPMDEQTTYTSRINITFRFYREDFHPSPSVGPLGVRQGTPQCKCGLPALLRADQKAKARARLPPSPSKPRPARDSDTDGCGTSQVIDDDMAFFWQCQSPGQTGDMKGCGFFRILDMRAEGRGPCVGDA